MAAPAERMKMMRQRRRARGLRELRLVVPTRLAGGATTGGEAGRRPRPGSRARRESGRGSDGSATKTWLGSELL